MLHRIPRSGLAASAVTVGYALSALELVPLGGFENFSAPLGIKCAANSAGLLGPMLQSHPPRD